MFHAPPLTATFPVQWRSAWPNLEHTSDLWTLRRLGPSQLGSGHLLRDRVCHRQTDRSGLFPNNTSTIAGVAEPQLKHLGKKPSPSPSPLQRRRCPGLPYFDHTRHLALPRSFGQTQRVDAHGRIATNTGAKTLDALEGEAGTIQSARPVRPPSALTTEFDKETPIYRANIVELEAHDLPLPSTSFLGILLLNALTAGGWNVPHLTLRGRPIETNDRYGLGILGLRNRLIRELQLLTNRPTNGAFALFAETESLPIPT